MSENENFDAIFNEYDRALSEAHQDIADGRGHPEAKLTIPVNNLMDNLSSLLEQESLRFTREDGKTVDGVILDYGVFRNNQIIGNIELKSPEKSADPTSLIARGHRKGRPIGWTSNDERQFNIISEHPNILYTNGSQWVLVNEGKKTFDVDLSPSDESKSSEEKQRASFLEMYKKFIFATTVSPTTYKQIAQRMAPLMRMLRDAIIANLKTHKNLSDDERKTAITRGLYNDGFKKTQKTLLGDATIEEFADSYAQILCYAKLLAQLEGDISHSDSLGEALDSTGHSFLAGAVESLNTWEIRKSIRHQIKMVDSFISSINRDLLKTNKEGHDSLLYFYEDFLAAYDSKARKKAGVYYTPIEIVQMQTRVVDDILKNKLGFEGGFANDEVNVLDPAVGTGTYPISIANHVLDRAETSRGVKKSLARRLYGFEIGMGSYAVSHLRLSELLGESSEGNVLLADTLRLPQNKEDSILQEALLGTVVADEQTKVEKVKGPETNFNAIIGNPPYSSQKRNHENNSVVYDKNGNDGLIKDWKKPLNELKKKPTDWNNLQEMSTHFYRWAVHQLVEKTDDPRGVISFIAPSAFLSGKNDSRYGMRKDLARKFDEILIVDLGGDSRTNKGEENVFAIQTGVAIVTLIRKDKTSAELAKVHYREVTGSRKEKLQQLSTMETLDPTDDDEWKHVELDEMFNFKPLNKGRLEDSPSLDKIFPWNASPIQAGRKWPISPDEDVLEKRWNRLTQGKTSSADSLLFGENGERKISNIRQDILTEKQMQSLSTPEGAKILPPIARLSYRPFDTQSVFRDSRLMDRPYPTTWQITEGNDKQLFVNLTRSNLTEEGTSLTASHLVSERGGGASKVTSYPLYRDNSANTVNITEGLIDLLQEEYSISVSEENVVEYIVGIMGTEAFTDFFAEETRQGVYHLPITKNATLFAKVSELGRKLIAVSTGGERNSGDGDSYYRELIAEHRKAEFVAIEDDVEEKKSAVQYNGSENYPDYVKYSAEKESILLYNKNNSLVGKVAGIPQEVWNFKAGSVQVVKSWFGYRMRVPAGKLSSELDKMQSEEWVFDEDMLTMLTKIQFIVSSKKEAMIYIEKVMDSSNGLFSDDELPEPKSWQRKKPSREEALSTQRKGLF